MSTSDLDLDHHDQVDVHVLNRPKIKLTLKQRGEDDKGLVWKNPSQVSQNSLKCENNIVETLADRILIIKSSKCFKILSKIEL